MPPEVVPSANGVEETEITGGATWLSITPVAVSVVSPLDNVAPVTDEMVNVKLVLASFNDSAKMGTLIVTEDCPAAMVNWPLVVVY